MAQKEFERLNEEFQSKLSEACDEHIKGLKLLDDELFTQVMEENPYLIQKIFDLIGKFYPFPKLTVKKVTSYRRLNNTVVAEEAPQKGKKAKAEEAKAGEPKLILPGHDVIFDLEVAAEERTVGKDGKVEVREHNFAIEAQTYAEKGIELRLRYYFDMMDLGRLRSGKEYSELPDQYVILISNVNMIKQKYALDYPEARMHYSGEPYDEKRHLFFLTSRPREEDPRFAEVVQFVSDLDQREPSKIQDSDLQDVFRKAKKSLTEDKMIRQEILDKLVRGFREIDPDGSRTQAALAELTALREEDQRRHEEDQRRHEEDQRKHEEDQRLIREMKAEIESLKKEKT